MSRVHFADGVLEVALSAELELNRFSRPVMVSDDGVVSTEFTERVNTGMPFWCHCIAGRFSNIHDRGSAVLELKKTVQQHQADVLIAFGSAVALSLADCCCQEMQRSHSSEYDRYSSPSLFAIPGVDGLPAMSSASAYRSYRATGFSRRGIQPAAVIIDPTLIMGESVGRTASAVANTLARCLSTLFSCGYNPPADGIALDGYKRIVQNISEMAISDSLEMRRELMAASLNGTLAMEKGPGLALKLCELLRRDVHTVDEGALMRILIVAEAQLMELCGDNTRAQELFKTLQVPGDQTLSAWISSVFAQLPLPSSLSELGIGPNLVDSAVDELAAQKAPAVASARVLANLLNALDIARFQREDESLCVH